MMIILSGSIGKHQVRHHTYIIDKVDGHILSDLVGQVFQVRPVLLRNDDRIYLSASGCQYFFLDPADRKDPSREGHFPGHGYITPGGAFQEKRNERHEHGDAGGRTVLLYRSRRHVNMDIVMLEKVLGYAERGGIAPDVAESGLGGFLHHITERARDDEFLLAFHHRRLDENDISSR